MTRTVDNPYRHYTASEIDAANDTDLPELLDSLGYHVKRVGQFYTTLEMDSLRIKNRRTWFRYSEATGGDAIAFVRHFHGMSFPEAVRYLLEFNGYSGDSFTPLPRSRIRPHPQRERPDFVLPPPYSDNERVCAYLRGRGIASSDKRTAFRLPCDPALHDVSVFESPIDLMSWITLYGQVTAVALCGLYEGPLDTYLRENPGVNRIVLCLDADRPGKEAAERMRDQYAGQGYAVSCRPPPCGKDWNEYLQMKGAT